MNFPQADFPGTRTDPGDHRLLQKQSRPAPAHRPRCSDHNRALDPVPARHVAVLPGHAVNARGDRPQRETDRNRADGCVPGRGRCPGAGECNIVEEPDGSSPAPGLTACRTPHRKTHFPLVYDSVKSGPVKDPVVRLLPHPLFWRGNNSEKRGNSPGTMRGLPAGINEAVCSNVTVAEGG